MKKVLRFVDLVLFDIKHMEQAKHKEGTGVENKLILSNAGKTAELVRTWFRVPLITGFNDSTENIQQTADFASTLHIEKVSILPYHELGSDKYLKLGRKYLMQKAVSPSSENCQTATRIFESYGLKVEELR